MDPRRNGTSQRAQKTVRRLLANPLIVGGGTLVALFLLVALLGPGFAPYDPMNQDVSRARERPSRQHWFGTDELGRDVLSRVVAGARISLQLSVVTLLVSCSFGFVVGLVSGYFGGALDTVLMRLIDIQLAVPSLVLALVIVSTVGVGLGSLILVMSISFYPSFARLTRGLALKIREEGYVEAARAIGATDRRIVGRHILPNVLSEVLALATVTLGRVVLIASSLGFLGFGVEPGIPEWGTMIAQGRTLFRTHPHVVFFPGVAILMVVIGFNLLGDGLRDFLDPRLRGGT